MNKHLFPHHKESPSEIVQLAPLVSKEMIFENVDGRTTDHTDAGVIGILIAHLGALGSGALIIGDAHSRHKWLLQSLQLLFCRVSIFQKDLFSILFKAAYSVTMKVFRNFFFLFKSFVKVELSYVFTIKMFSLLKTAWKSELSHQIGVFFSCW